MLTFCSIVWFSLDNHSMTPFGRINQRTTYRCYNREPYWVSSSFLLVSLQLQPFLAHACYWSLAYQVYFPLRYNDIFSTSADNFSPLEFAFHYLFRIWFAITSQCTIIVCFLFEQMLGQPKWIVVVICVKTNTPDQETAPSDLIQQLLFDPTSLDPQLIHLSRPLLSWLLHLIHIIRTILFGICVSCS